MNNKKAFFLSMPILLMAFLSSSLLLFNFIWPGEPAKDKNQAVKQVIMGSLDQVHFNNQIINDNFSKKAFDLYLKILDGNKLFLRKSDYEQMASYQQKIDDELKGDFGQFLKISASIVDDRIQDAKAYKDEILSKPFDFTKEEILELDDEKVTYATTKEEHKARWHQYLKYQTMLQLYNKAEAQKSKKELAAKEGKDFEEKTLQELEEAAREQVNKTYSDWLSRLEREDDDDKRAKLMNAIVGVFGPHTTFYPPEEKESFDIQMSGKLEGIGAQLLERDGEIKVTNIVPGSASWKQGELKKDDVILKVGQDGEEPVPIVGMLLKDAVQLIRGPKGTTVHLTVKKKSGEIEVIPIVRDVVILEESFVKSAVLDNEKTGHKVGYIMLPSFYADFSRTGGRNSGEDVKIELEKLKAQNVDAVIFDLRNNGGGSLWDAVKITGLFIPSGPIVQVRDRINSSKIHRDPDRETVYDGPLVVMLNKSSASASEITAAALQDYGRAVVVGENSFGKGTVQRFIELDNFIDSRYKPAGSLKLTTQKFYRISGKTTQVKGVQPDIKLPDAYAYLEYGEKELDHVLPFDEIEPALFARWNKSSFDLDKLAKNSQKRVKKNETFQLLDQYAKTLKSRQDDTKHTLNYAAFVAEQEKLEEESKKFDNLKFEHNDFIIKVMPPVTGTMPQGDDLAKVQTESAKRWQSEIEKDVYIYEASNIVEEMIK